MYLDLVWALDTINGFMIGHGKQKLHIVEKRNRTRYIFPFHHTNMIYMANTYLLHIYQGHFSDVEHQFLFNFSAEHQSADAESLYFLSNDTAQNSFYFLLQIDKKGQKKRRKFLSCNTTYSDSLAFHMVSLMTRVRHFQFDVLLLKTLEHPAKALPVVKVTEVERQYIPVLIDPKLFQIFQESMYFLVKNFSGYPIPWVRN